MRRRSTSRPTPIKTDQIFDPEHHISIVPALDPSTERELRKSCSLLLLTPPPKPSSIASRRDSNPRSLLNPPPKPSSITSRRDSNPRSLLSADLPALPAQHIPRSPLHNPETNLSPTNTAAVLSIRKADLRASQIEIRRVDRKTDRSATPDRASTFLLAKPTLVDVLPSPSRPRTAGSHRTSALPPPTPGTPAIPAKTPLGESQQAFPPTPFGRPKTSSHEKTNSGNSDRRTQQEALFSARPQTSIAAEKTFNSRTSSRQQQRERPQTGHGHEKTLSGTTDSSDQRLSLFPRPRTAHGSGSTTSAFDSSVSESYGGRALPPLPKMPQSVVVAKIEETPAQQPREKEKKKNGFVQFQAFWKATFRFGRKHGAKPEVVRSVP